MQPRFAIGALLIFAALATIAIALFFSNQELYYTVDELVLNEDVYRVESPPAQDSQGSIGQADQVAAKSPRLQVRGSVDYSTVTRPSEGLEMRFTLIGETGRLPVVYDGLVPDTFDQAEQVTVGGRLSANGTLMADQLFVQCPSKYEAVPPGSDSTDREASAGG